MYAVYQDPEETGCPFTYPFAVEVIVAEWTALSPSLHALVLVPMIYSADLSDPSCPRPGDLLHRGAPQEVAFDPSGDPMTPLELAERVCVSRPYFAVIEILDIMGPSPIYLALDDGVSMIQPTPRWCASYLNTTGRWGDLVVDAQWPGNVLLWSGGHNDLQNTCTSCVESIEAGVDLWITARDGDLISHSIFAGNPLPADFFGPGSDPFDGIVAFEGDPLPTDPPGALGEADAIIERKEPIFLPSVPSAYSIEIEMIALHLVSSDPIQVSYMGGMYHEEWNVEVCLSPVPNMMASGLEINLECCIGGQFNWVGGFRPRFIFTNPQQVTEMIYDYPTLLPFPTGAYWTSIIHPPWHLTPYSPGYVTVDHDCDGATADRMVPPSNKIAFSRLGYPWFEEPCGNCCQGIVGDANGSGDPEPTIGDVSMMIDALFITGSCTGLIECLAEADVNQSGGADPSCGDVTIGDVSMVIDYLFITGSDLMSLPLCL
jgi:hypothetical protein